MMKKALLAAVVAASVAGLSGPVLSAPAVVVVQTAPPAPRHEVMPSPRHGKVWVEGHWRWTGNRYAWDQGHWVSQRSGYAWNNPQWVERNGRWYYTEGNWRRGSAAMGNRGVGDRDHDGVANRDDRDRDGDGVRNRNDRHPNNPNRN
jgi:hypothetical protein